MTCSTQIQKHRQGEVFGVFHYILINVVIIFCAFFLYLVGHKFLKTTTFLWFTRFIYLFIYLFMGKQGVPTSFLLNSLQFPDIRWMHLQFLSCYNLYLHTPDLFNSLTGPIPSFIHSFVCLFIYYQSCFLINSSFFFNSLILCEYTPVIYRRDHNELFCFFLFFNFMALVSW